MIVILWKAEILHELETTGYDECRGYEITEQAETSVKMRCTDTFFILLAKALITHNATSRVIYWQYGRHVTGVALVLVPVWQLKTSRGVEKCWLTPELLVSCTLQTFAVLQWPWAAQDEASQWVTEENEREGTLQPAPRQIICQPPTGPQTQGTCGTHTYAVYNTYTHLSPAAYSCSTAECLTERTCLPPFSPPPPQIHPSHLTHHFFSSTSNFFSSISSFS